MSRSGASVGASTDGDDNYSDGFDSDTSQPKRSSPSKSVLSAVADADKPTDSHRSSSSPKRSSTSEPKSVLAAVADADDSGGSKTSTSRPSPKRSVLQDVGDGGGGGGAGSGGGGGGDSKDSPDGPSKAADPGDRLLSRVASAADESKADGPPATSNWSFAVGAAEPKRADKGLPVSAEFCRRSPIAASIAASDPLRFDDVMERFFDAVDDVDEDGRNMLHYAASVGDSHFICTLLGLPIAPLNDQFHDATLKLRRLTLEHTGQSVTLDASLRSTYRPSASAIEPPSGHGPSGNDPWVDLELDRLQRVLEVRKEEAFLQQISSTDDEDNTVLHYAAAGGNSNVDAIFSGAFGGNLDPALFPDNSLICLSCASITAAPAPPPRPTPASTFLSRLADSIGDGDGDGSGGEDDPTSCLPCHAKRVPVHVLRQKRRAVVNAVNSEGQTALHLASARSDSRALLTLLAAGADRAIQDAAFHTALMVAPDTATRRLLAPLAVAVLDACSLAGVAVPDPHDETAPALVPPVVNREALRTLLDTGEDVNRATGVLLRTPLHLAASTGRASIVTYLLEDAGADPTVMDVNGWNALHVAAAGLSAGHSSCATALIVAGVDVNVTSNQGKTPLHIAAAQGPFTPSLPASAGPGEEDEDAGRGSSGGSRKQGTAGAGADAPPSPAKDPVLGASASLSTIAHAATHRPVSLRGDVADFTGPSFVADTWVGGKAGTGTGTGTGGVGVATASKSDTLRSIGGDGGGLLSAIAEDGDKPPSGDPLGLLSRIGGDAPSGSPRGGSRPGTLRTSHDDGSGRVSAGGDGFPRRARSPRTAAREEAVALRDPTNLPGDMLSLLVQHGAYLEARDDRGFTPLMVACAKGNYEAVDRLLVSGADLYVRDDAGRSVLMLAAAGGHARVVSLLSRFDCETGYLKGMTDRAGRSVNDVCRDRRTRLALVTLWEAAAAGQLDVVNSMIRLDDIESDQSVCMERTRVLRRNALHCVVSGAGREMWRLLRAEATSARGSGSRRPRRASHAAKLPHGIGIPLNLKASDPTALLPLRTVRAVRRRVEERYSRVALALMRKAKRLVDLADNDGVSALALAARSGLPGLARLILDMGARADGVDTDGNTALHWARAFRQHEVASLLEDASPELVDVLNDKDKNAEDVEGADHNLLSSPSEDILRAVARPPPLFAAF